MENTLDGVLVKYIALDSKSPAITTYKDFLTLSPEKLPSDTLWLQKEMARLYNLNNRRVPLYHSFPKRKNKSPLTIDASTIEKAEEKEHSTASFVQGINSIIFYQAAKECNLLNILAHELKHAEQFSDDRTLINENGLALRQLEYLAEAQAYTFEAYIWLIDCIENKRSFSTYQKDLSSFERHGIISKNKYEKYIKENSSPDWKSFESENLLKILFKLYYHSYYKNNYDECFPPVKKTDTDILQIPESFYFSKKFINKELLKALKKAPRKSAKKETRFLQLLLNNQRQKAKIFLLQNFIKKKSIIQGGLDLLDDYSLLNHISLKDYRNLLKKLKQCGANLDKQDEDGHTSLMLAVMEDNIDKIKALADAGANLDIPNGQMGDVTALHMAAVHGNKEVVKALIEAHINLDATDDMGFTALSYALFKKNIDIFKMLIEAGANLDLQDKKDGYTILHEAVLIGDKDAIKMLVNTNINIDIKSNNGKKADELVPINRSEEEKAEIAEILSLSRAKKEHKENIIVPKKTSTKQKINIPLIATVKSKELARS